MYITVTNPKGVEVELTEYSKGVKNGFLSRRHTFKHGEQIEFIWIEENTNGYTIEDMDGATITGFHKNDIHITDRVETNE